MVPETLLQADISYRAFKVAVAIYLHADRHSGECHPTNNTLSDATGIDPRHVRDCLNELDDAGLIRRSGATTKRVIRVSQLGTKTVPSTRDQNGPPTRDQNGPPGGTKTVPSTRDQNGPPIRTDQVTDHLTDHPAPGAGAREGMSSADVRRLCKLADDKWPMLEVGYKLHSILPGYPAEWGERAIQEAGGRSLGDPASYIRGILQKYAASNGPPPVAVSIAEGRRGKGPAPAPTPDQEAAYRARLDEIERDALARQHRIQGA
jgi:hypothetical protein